MNILKTSLLTAFILMTGSSVVADSCPTQNATATAACACPSGANGPKCPTQSACEKCYSTTCYNIGGEEGEAYWGPCPWEELCDYAGASNAATCFNACHISCGS